MIPYIKTFLFVSLLIVICVLGSTNVKAAEKPRYSVECSHYKNKSVEMINYSGHSVSFIDDKSRTIIISGDCVFTQILQKDSSNKQDADFPEDGGQRYNLK